MSKFYLTDPNILTANISDTEFRIYQYLCSNYNVLKKSAYVRIVDIAGLHQLTKDEVEKILIKFSQIKVNDLPLLSMTKDKYIKFDMPSHKKFLEEVGFKKFSNKGFQAINGHLKEVHQAEFNKVYLFPRLDQHELYDQLEHMSTEELKKFKSSQFQYPWVLRDVIKNRA